MNFKKFLCSLILILLASFQYDAFAYNQTIKVGVILDNSFYKIEDNGVLSGFNYDYLMKVAQYTNWNYDFIIIEDENLSVSYLKARDMLKNGEIDLLGSMYFEEENLEFFEYSSLHYGISRSTICALSNNSTITVDNFFLKDSLRVALVKNQVNSINHFFSVVEKYNIEPIITYVDYQEEALELLRNEQVDVIMTTDTSAYRQSLVTLDSDNPEPFYFVSQVGNYEILEQLDMAITKIETAQPNINQNLIQTYFNKDHSGDMILNSFEKRVLSQYDYFTIGLIKNIEPYQFFEDNTVKNHGISIEILNLISSIIGKEFRYVWVDDFDELTQKINAREIDIVATLPLEYELSKVMNVTLSNPYISGGALWLYNENGKNIDDEIFYHYVSDNIPFFSDDKLIFAYDIEQKILDLSNNSEISIFCDPYIANYHIQKLGITNVDVQSVSNVVSNIVLGVGNHIDPVILGILNHSILHFDAFEIDEIIHRNIIFSSEYTLKAFISDHSTLIFMIISAFLSVLLFALYYHLSKMTILANSDSLTHLYNAGFFHSHAKDVMKKSSCGALIIFDIDYFKQVNDTYGHQNGDAVIIEVAKGLVNHFSLKNTTIARLGGDEFVILINNSCNKADLEDKCRLLLLELAQNPLNLPVTLSIGGYIYSDNITYEQLYKLSDEMLYFVKENNRNNFKFND